MFYTILFNLIAQALKMKDFLLPMLTGIDSRPIYANVNGYKHKRCACPDQNKCACEKTYSDPDPPAACSVKRNILLLLNSSYPIVEEAKFNKL